MFCEMYADWGILYLYDELETAARHNFEAHLKTCHRCQAELALLKESKQFVQMLPLEEIAPKSYEEIVPSVKPTQTFFEEYIQPFWDSIRLIFPTKRRLVLVPVAVSFLLLMMFYLFNPKFKSSVAPYDETAFEWDVGLRESLDTLDQKIVQLKSETLIAENTSTNSTFYSAVDNFSDQHFDQIAADIQTLSSELSQFNF